MCGQNEEWKDGNDYFQKCYNDARVGCSRDLVLIGCYCKSGYLRHPETEACIPASECPLTGDTVVYPVTTEKSALEILSYQGQGDPSPLTAASVTISPKESNFNHIPKNINKNHPK